MQNLRARDHNFPQVLENAKDLYRKKVSSFEQTTVKTA